MPFRPLNAVRLRAGLWSLLAVGWLTHGAALEDSAPMLWKSQRSGDWGEAGLWVRVGQASDGREARRGPAPDDLVWIAEGHAVRLAGRSVEVAALQIDGSLDLPEVAERGPADSGTDRGAELRSQIIRVASSGSLRARGPHRLVLGADDPSNLNIAQGGELDLQGSLLVEGGTAGTVLEDRVDRIVVEDPTRSWVPGELQGARFQFTTGHARTWQFEILDNTATAVHLSLGRLGSPTNKHFMAEIEKGQRRRLRTPADTVRLEEGGYRDRQVRGRWVRWVDAAGAPRHGLITGQRDGGMGAKDALILWPPIPFDEAPRDFKLTYGAQSGDRYRITRPLELSVPEEFRLPARTLGKGFRILARPRSRVTLRDLSVAYGWIKVVGRSDEGAPSRATLEYLDIHHFNSSCAVALENVRGVRLRGLRIRDVHPNSLPRSRGGIWPEEGQRGHGICASGDDLTIEDSRLSSLNDDLIWLAESGDVRVRGNFGAGAGIFQGDSFEALTAVRLHGPLEVSGNVLLGAQATIRLGARDAAARITIAGNLLAQDEYRKILIDSAEGDAGPVVFLDNLVLGSGWKMGKILFANEPERYRGNHLVAVQARGPKRAIDDRSYATSMAFLEGVVGALPR